MSPPYLFPTRGLPQPVQENTVRGNTPGNTQTRLRNTVVLAQEGGSFSLDESLRDAFFLASETWREGRSLRRNSNDGYRIPLLAFRVNLYSLGFGELGIMEGRQEVFFHPREGRFLDPIRVDHRPL